MAKLKLYTAFHLNLAFSAIPQEQYSLVLDKCYWPMLDILEKYNNIRFGIEFTGYTIEKIKEIDYTFINKLKELHSKGKCEYLGSGLSQAIFSLIPQKVNEKNLELGNIKYKNILGDIPKTGYSNEQTFSDGVAGLYKNSGYSALIVEYENAAIFNNYPVEFRYQGHKLKTKSGEINIIWNNSTAFQKFQHYAFGAITIDEYMEFLESHIGAKERTLCMYGSDLEIFDYKPGNHDWFHDPKPSKEIERIMMLFERLDSDGRFEFVLPETVAVENNSNEVITISTPEYPVTCKKQPKYNAVRWAVSGTDNNRMNTECYKLFGEIETAEMNSESDEKEWEKLCLLWASDYRTKTTESKMKDYYSLLGKQKHDIESKLNRVFPKLSSDSKYDFYFLNVGEKINNPVIIEGEVQFTAGRVYVEGLYLYINGAETVFQLENTEFYRDMSIRKTKVVFEMKEIITPSEYFGEFKNGTLRENKATFKLDGNFIETENVKLKFSRAKNGIIKGITFKNISDIPVVGTIPHGYYDDIRHCADFYTGHTIIRDKELNQKTDLDRAKVIYPDESYYPIRIPVKCKTANESMDDVWKVYYIYTNQNRVDIEYHFRFKDMQPYFMRSGIVTINPEYFDKATLGYSVKNGGEREIYLLSDKEIEQTAAVNPGVTSTSCMGATDGVMHIFDASKELFIERDNTTLYSVPMLDYTEIKGKYFMRVYHSLSETDDTGGIFWRGHSTFRISIHSEKEKAFDSRIIFRGKNV